MGKKIPRDPMSEIGGPLIAIHADRLMFWSFSTRAARESITTDPDRTAVMLEALADQMGQFCATARRDDPTLPEEYRRLLGE